MKTTAAVLVELAGPLELMDLDVPALAPGQVLVRVDVSGVCHTQLLEARGHRGPDAYLPHCLGHEGAGEVVDVGSDVKKVRPGDRVVLSWIAGDGAQVHGCVYHDARGRQVNAGAMTTFMTHAVVSENRLTVAPDNLSSRDAAMLGCALPTGFGAVINTGELAPGQTVVVFGAGGVGLSAAMGAKLAGAKQVIVVDPIAHKRETAATLGATQVIDPESGDVLAQLAAVAPGGIDLAIEATGRPAVMAMALAAVKPRGGKAVIIGNAHQGQTIALDPKQLNLGKQLRGTWGGDTQPDRDLPRFTQLLTTHQCDLSPMLTTGYRLEQINDALDDLESGKAVRPMIQIHPEVTT